MIYIVHGEDISKSRIMIQNQQNKCGCTRQEMSISNITPEGLYEICCSNDLFGTPPFVVLDISSAGRINLEPYIEKIEKIPEQTTLIILSNKQLTKTNAFIKNAGRLKAKLNLNELKPQSNIFKFVDAVFYKQRENAYLELSKLINDSVSSFEIIPMMFYGLRNVSTSKFNSPSYNKSSGFIKNKAHSQSLLFSDQQLINIYEEFRKLDMKSKIGEIDEDVLVPMAVEIVLNS